MRVSREERRLYVDKLTHTLKELMDKALENSDEGSRPKWRVVYKQTVVAEFRLATVKGRYAN